MLLRIATLPALVSEFPHASRGLGTVAAAVRDAFGTVIEPLALGARI
ncbi:hypothetical protein [Saccharopolyspora pogona]|nr:hypothetical protein [Saccharopolyspora pogona]